MRFCLIAVLIMLLSFSSMGMAQESGSFIASFDIGITSAMGEFKDDGMAANGFGLGAELQYTLFQNLSFGPFARYHRFGLREPSTDGTSSYNFTQYGGVAKLNLFDVDKGKLYVVGGGGMFTPNYHIWTPDYVSNDEWDTGTFFMGGLGISSNPFRKTVFQLEVRYNLGTADYVMEDAFGEETSEEYKFDFLYFLVKISFNSKGKSAPPRY